MRFNIHTLMSLLLVAFCVLFLSLVPHKIFTFLLQFAFYIYTFLLVISFPAIFFDKTDSIWRISGWINHIMRKFRLLNHNASYDKHNWIAMALYACLIFILSLAPMDFYQTVLIGIFSSLCCACLLLYLQYSYEKHVLCNKALGKFSALKLFFTNVNRFIDSIRTFSSSLNNGEIYINELISRTNILNNYIKQITQYSVDLNTVISSYYDINILNNTGAENIKKSRIPEYIKNFIIPYNLMSIDNKKLQNIQEISSVNDEIFRTLLDTQDIPVDCQTIMLHFIRSTGTNYKTASAAHLKNEIDEIFNRLDDFNTFTITAMDKLQVAMHEFIRLQKVIL